MCHAILLISCPDQRGITAVVTNFIYSNNGNIVHADQHIDEQSNTFFMRIEWSLQGFNIEKDNISDNLSVLAQNFSMTWELGFTNELSKVAVFVSKHLHCLYDLLYRWKAGQIRCEIPVVISNHPDARKISEDFGIIFHEISKTDENKAEQEKKEIEILKKENIDLVVLARYHQILSSGFVNEFKNKIINIHHSFLPAFAGRSPYAQAYSKGVKLIGATSHYVTKDLDQGPIIEQSTVRVSHRDSLYEMILKGEDLEKIVLSRAVRWHLERKILSYSNKTVVFD